MKSEIIQDLVSDLKHVKFLGTSFVIEEKQWTKQQMLPAQQGHGLPPLRSALENSNEQTGGYVTDSCPAPGPNRRANSAAELVTRFIAKAIIC